ncbi:hypothetical protein DP939_11930 [Spongiactinospora rosea]|uniref:Uncharacterized protein n=1 Tax=Spongiactinospora rosea TaxID=2248750 RepID=A0A366M2Q3_9ACTN|nr:hypothetical protein [Spongiactinospora rosea]RBQ20476.1 hypothetical protein DP939_11930 [Spongiactinospora rosea]
MLSPAEMTYTELAVALYASDMPTGARATSIEQMAAWIAQGTARLGGRASVKWYAFQDEKQNTTPGDHSADRAGLWSDSRREGTARVRAWMLARTLASAMATATPERVA